VFINGKIVNSCLVPVAQVEGAEIKTIEGITTDNQLHAVQQRHRMGRRRSVASVRPAWCWPPSICWDANPILPTADIRTGRPAIFAGCTGYMKIFRVRGAGVSGALEE